MITTQNESSQNTSETRRRDNRYISRRIFRETSNDVVVYSKPSGLTDLHFPVWYLRRRSPAVPARSASEASQPPPLPDLWTDNRTVSGGRPDSSSVLKTHHSACNSMTNHGISGMIMLSLCASLPKNNQYC